MMTSLHYDGHITCESMKRSLKLIRLDFNGIDLILVSKV